MDRQINPDWFLEVLNKNITKMRITYIPGVNEITGVLVLNKEYFTIKAVRLDNEVTFNVFLGDKLACRISNNSGPFIRLFMRFEDSAACCTEASFFMEALKNAL